MPERNSNPGNYRYGFNGKEKDQESGTQDYGMRIYNPSLGKFLSVDPLSMEFPWNSTYAFAENTPIQATDLDGAEKHYATIKEDDEKSTITVFTKVDVKNKSIAEGPLGSGIMINGKYYKNLNEYKGQFKDKISSLASSNENRISDPKSWDNKSMENTSTTSTVLNPKKEVIIKDEPTPPPVPTNTTSITPPTIPTPPPPPSLKFSNTDASVFWNNTMLKDGFKQDKDFYNYAGDLVKYLMANSSVNITITMGGAYTAGKSADVGPKSWFDPLNPAIFNGPTYHDRALAKFNRLVDAVYNLSGGKVDKTRFNFTEGKLTDSDMHAAPVNK
jgi:RHS repeat-associated protein